jgi:nitrogen-specific signal transduction histidine kinase
LYIDKLASMRDTLFGIYMMDQIEQASVLDTLPDPVIIVDQDKISYMNSEAWSLLNCVGSLADVENFNLVSCIDKISGKV